MIGVNGGAYPVELTSPMIIDNHIVAKKLNAYLQHQITLAELVDWAENAIFNGEFENKNFEPVRDVVARLGVAHVRAFGLTWEDCEQLLQQLGYNARVSVIAV
jgi:hypothetical protein